MKTNNVPQLRFSGFDDEWAEKKLGEISSKVSKKNTDNSITETFTNSAEFGVISQRDFFDHDISNDENIDGYFIVENDDFVYNPRISTIAPVGPINRNKLGRSGVMSPLYYVFRTHDIDKTFLEKYFKSECWYDFMFLNGNSGARSDRFSITDSVFSQMPIRVPNSEIEQQKIGSFLSHVDSLIQAKTKKLESLKAVKKSLLQKCFPKAGEKVPEMRFAGFSGEWEEKKLGEIAEKIMVGIANSATYAYSDDGVVMLRNQNIKPNYLDEDDLIYLSPSFEITYKNKRLKENDILVARTGYPGTACVVPQKFENAQTFTTLILRLRLDVLQPYFVTQYMNSPIGIAYFTSTQIGGGQKNSGAGILYDMPFRFPKIDEQQKIGQFFSKYDSLISSQQKEIDKLKDIKKSLLQKMFV